MSSFHRGDWLSVAQTVASIVAIGGAFGVVFLQNYLERRRAYFAEVRQLLRERYRSSTYVQAVVGNSVDAATEIVNGVAELVPIQEHMGNTALETDRLDSCSAALAQALHQPLPTELLEKVHSAWAASQLLARAAHRTKRQGKMKTATLLEYCRVQQRVLVDVHHAIEAARKKWHADLLREGSLVDKLRDSASNH
ncbi:hypothetical protein [Burkholderia ubonensis]|uniref:hypothetical protein n=1 Tax=Burkholderia ubonensis TaxID=101571 RepID=UPI0012FAA2A1|nr:hypothetical protein [Burkholderia ubonensis]